MNLRSLDKELLQAAIAKAGESVTHGGFPAGAIVAKNGKVISEGISIGLELHDPTSHGEMAAIRNACTNLQTSSLTKATLYASMQPCLMCFSASVWASIPRIVYACSKDKVSPEYYGGNYSISEINEHLLHSIELVHLSELEEESLAIVRKWEKTIARL